MAAAREGGACYREFPSVNCIFNPLVTPAFYFFGILPPIVSLEVVKLLCLFVCLFLGFFLFVCLVQVGLSALLFSHANLINKLAVIFFFKC